MVLGDDNVQPSPAQLEQMKALVREAMKDGHGRRFHRAGVRSSALCEDRGTDRSRHRSWKIRPAFISTHMRNESDSVLEAIDEALRIGREAHVPVEIWHIKVAGKNNWGRMPEVVAKINSARAAAPTSPPTLTPTPPGSTISPLSFRSGHTMVEPQNSSSASKIPPPASASAKTCSRPPKSGTTNGRKSRSRCRHDRRRRESEMLPLEGKRLSEIARLWNKDPMDALFDFLIEDPTTGVAVFGMSQPDVTLALQTTLGRH